MDRIRKAGDTLVIVVYYTQSIPDLVALVDDFSAASGIEFQRIVAIDNGGGLAQGPVDHRITVIEGDNSFWEFSGWARGLRDVDEAEAGIVVLLNDSYRKNWTIGWPGRLVIGAMLRDARKGKIAGWLDNFTRLERRVNSRIVIASQSRTSTLRRSIEQAILECRASASVGPDLFDQRTARILSDWMRAQSGRWTPASSSSRWPRIFVEHHLFDTVPASELALRPKRWITSQLYGVFRKLARERR